MIGVLIRKLVKATWMGKQCEETQRTPYEDGGRKWRDMSMDKEHQGLAGSHQKPGERHVTREPPRRNQPYKQVTIVSDSGFLNDERINFCYLMLLSLWQFLLVLRNR